VGAYATSAGGSFRVLTAGDEALLCEFGSGLDPDVNRQAQAFAQAVRDAAIPGVRAVTPGYLSVLVAFDAAHVAAPALLPRLAELARGPARVLPARRHVIPVCYGGEMGPDLEDVAARAGLPPDEVVRRHAAQEYRVYCLGFSPGFPLAASLPPELRLPRRAEPRTRVPAGSVAIAGHQTGIYPFATSGGWHLIGRTSVRVFSWRQPEEPLFRAGDTIAFRPVGLEEYRELLAAAEARHG
jgi:KipI family sensor histidine kinase inhibitor